MLTGSKIKLQMFFRWQADIDRFLLFLPIWEK